MIGTQEEFCLFKKNMTMSSPNLPKAEYIEFELPNVMSLYTLNILSESLPFFIHLGLAGHTVIVQSDIESDNAGL